jgi:hypothetical protein
MTSCASHQAHQRRGTLTSISRLTRPGNGGAPPATRKRQAISNCGLEPLFTVTTSPRFAPEQIVKFFIALRTPQHAHSQALFCFASLSAHNQLRLRSRLLTATSESPHRNPDNCARDSSTIPCAKGTSKDLTKAHKMARISQFLSYLHWVMVAPQHQYHNISRVMQPQLRCIGESFCLGSSKTKKQEVPLQLLKRKPEIETRKVEGSK